MTIAMPGVRPAVPHFSSGPCAKRPGWTLASPQRRIARPLAPRQSRQGASSSAPSNRRAKCSKCRPITASASCRPPIPARSRWRCGRCSGARPVNMLAWEVFGEGWVTDVAKQLKLKDVTRAQGGLRRAARSRRRSISTADVVFTWNGTTSGVRVPNARLDRGRPRGPHHLRRDFGRLRAAARFGTSSMSSPSPGRRRSAARRRTAC